MLALATAMSKLGAGSTGKANPIAHGQNMSGSERWRKKRLQRVRETGECDLSARVGGIDLEGAPHDAIARKPWLCRGRD